jgi:hypothetical protein
MALPEATPQRFGNGSEAIAAYDCTQSNRPHWTAHEGTIEPITESVILGG